MSPVFLSEVCLTSPSYSGQTLILKNKTSADILKSTTQYYHYISHMISFIKKEQTKLFHISVVLF